MSFHPEAAKSLGVAAAGLPLSSELYGESLSLLLIFSPMDFILLPLFWLLNS
jgi:hypothetical protein